MLTDSPLDWLGSTPLIDKEHPRVREKAADLARGGKTDRDVALAVFNFVRDEIEFGFARGFWKSKASQVLATGRGYCNTKSTLFIALLRANRIPARQVFVDIHSSVLHGILNPGTPYVDHSYVEVFLEGDWIPTDAYIVDRALFEPAQARVLAENRLMGYGVHGTGTMLWDGKSSAFSQFNLLDPHSISTRRWGLFSDVGDFYRFADDPWNRLNPLFRAAMGAMGNAANKRADAIRASRG
ncbi:MAG: transglutaminase-like domain-containing protein [Pseudomonadota bacterium]